MPRSTGARSRAISLVAAAAAWGSATAISKRAVDEIEPLTLLPIQLAVSVITLTAAFLLTGRRLVWSRRHRRLAQLGILNPGISYALSLAGLARVTASTSVLLWALEPILILAIAYFVLEDRITLRLGACTATALAGVLLVVVQPGASVAITGVALTLAGVAACALYTVLSTKYLTDESSLAIVLSQQVAALGFAIVLFVGSLLFGDGRSVTSVSTTAWASAVVAGVLYYGIAFWFYVNGLRGMRASFAGMFLNLIPVFGLAVSYVFLGERLTGRQWIGSAIVVASVAAIATIRTHTGSAVCDA